MNTPLHAGIERLLVIRLDNLGDVLVTTPAIHALRQGLPGAKITLLASPVGAQVGTLNPDIDQVITRDVPWMDPWGQLPRSPERELDTIRTVAGEHFDAAFIFTSFRQSALPAAYLCYLADIPIRIAASIDGPGSLLTLRHKHPDRPMHEVERGLDLVAAAGFATDDPRLVLHTPETARQAIGERSIWTGGRPRVVLHPGCSMPARTYDPADFARVAELLVRELGAEVVLTGVAGERDLTEGILERIAPLARAGTRTLAGELSFPEFCALIESADLVVTNNTGPMHMAAALHTPVVALFAYTNPPRQWGPWMVHHRLLVHDTPCKVCYARACPVNHLCLTGIHPRIVLDACASLLNEVAAGASPPIHPEPVDVSAPAFQALATAPVLLTGAAR